MILPSESCKNEVASFLEYTGSMCELLFADSEVFMCSPMGWPVATFTRHGVSSTICRIGNTTTIHGVVRVNALYSRVDTETMTIVETFLGDGMEYMRDGSRVVSEDGTIYSLRMDHTRHEGIVTIKKHGTRTMMVGAGPMLSLVRSSPGGGIFVSGELASTWSLTRIDEPIVNTYELRECNTYNTFMRDNTTAVTNSDDGVRLIDLRQPRSIGLPFTKIDSGSFTTENIIVSLNDDMDACLFEKLYDIRAGGSVILETLIDGPYYGGITV